jgi:hypothetical protein
MRMNLLDSQDALAFLMRQATHIESEVYKIQYPDIQYQQLIPIDTSANEWAKSVTFFSMDRVGQAAWFSHLATDMRIADVNRTKFEQGIEMAGIGYRYTLEELGFAQMIPGTNLGTERADAARFAYETFVDTVAFTGDEGKDWEGFINNSAVTRVDAANTGTGPSRLWSTKTADQMITDVNDALTGIYTGSNTVEMADTVLLPPAALILLSTTRIANTTENALSYLMKYNVYTLQTGRPLTIRAVLALTYAGTAGVGRMVVYKRDPRVVKMHIPMVHRFLPVWQTGPMVFDVPGIFRLGPVEIRRPGAVRYVDGITPVAA